MFFIQRTKLLSYNINPASHRIAAQLHALAAVDFSLTIQGKMFSELCHDDAGQQARAGVTTLDGFRRQRCLHDTVAPAAGQFWPHRFDNPEGCVDDIQLFGDTFAQRFQFTTADGAFVFWWVDKLPVAGSAAGSELRADESDAFGVLSPAIEVSCDCASPSLFWSSVMRFSACTIFFSIFSRFSRYCGRTAFSAV